MCWLAIWILSLEKYLFRSFAHSLIRFLFLLLDSKSFLYILDINPLSDIWFPNIFLPLSRFFLDGFSLLWKGLLVWYGLISLFLLLLSLLLLSIQKSHCKTDVKLLFPYVFVTEFYTFRSYVQVFSPFWVDFHSWCKTEAQVHSFTCSRPVFPAQIIEETILYPLYILGSFVVNKMTVNMWVYVWALSSVPFTYVCVYGNTILFASLELCNTVWN